MEAGEIMDAIINEQFIDLELGSRNKETVISFMSEILLREGRITDKDAYIDSVLEREKLASTSVGFDVGIPHGKSDAVKTATVFFGRSDQGINWNEEGEQVKLVFLLAIPSQAASNHHLKILAALSRKLMDETFIKLLNNGKDKLDILNSLEETLASVTV